MSSNELEYLVSSAKNTSFELKVIFALNGTKQLQIKFTERIFYMSTIINALFSGLIAAIASSGINLWYQWKHDKSLREDELIYKQRVIRLNNLRMTVAKYVRACTALNGVITDIKYQTKYIHDLKRNGGVINNKEPEFKELFTIKSDLKRANDDWQEQETLLQLYLTNEDDDTAKKILDVIADINQKERKDTIPSSDLNKVINLAAKYFDDQMEKVKNAK